MPHSKFVRWLIVLIVIVDVLIGVHGLLKDKLVIVGDFTGSDLLDMHLPYKYILHNAYTKGVLPVWTSYLANGYPIWAEGQSGPMYSVNVALAWIEPYMALNWSIIFTFLVTGVGGYVYADSLKGMSKAGAVWVGLAFMFSSFFVARVKHLNMIEVASLLPWALWCVRKYYFSGLRIVWMMGLAIVWGLQMLAGHPHMFYLTFFMVMWHMGFEGWWYFGNERGGYTVKKYLTKLMTHLGLVGVLGVGLAAIQVLPTMELVKYSTRHSGVSGGYDSAVAYPFNPLNYATLVYPYLFGNPADGSYRFNLGVWWENVMYVGLSSIGLIIFYLWQGKKVWKLFKESFWNLSVGKVINRLNEMQFGALWVAVGMIVFGYISLGRGSLLHLIMYYTVPGFAYFRFPQRFNLYVLFGLCVLAGYGLSKLQKIKLKWGGRGWVICLFGMLLVEQWWFVSRYIGFVDAREYLKPSELIEKLPISEGKRIYSLTQYALHPYNMEGWMKVKDKVIARQTGLPGDNPARLGIEAFSNRNWFEGGLAIESRAYLERDLLEGKYECGDFFKIMGLFNVEWVIDDNNEYLMGKRPDFGCVKEKVEYGGGWVYRNPAVASRFWYVQEFGTLGDLLDGDWLKVEVKDLIYEDQRVKFDVAMSSDGVLVMSDMDYPGWGVWVDGEKRVKENMMEGLVRGVKLSKGVHNVEWRFESQSFKVGMLISLVSGVVVLLILGWDLFRKRLLR